ncbi:hypothetical protein L7F22_062187 [Adiantum nelumboides]|nr:hypothetical protein [Adiantum nelumboides]
MFRIALASFAKHKSMVLLGKDKEAGKGAVVQSLPHEKLHGKELPRGTLGISIKFASRPDVSLPYVPSIDDDIDTLGATIGTVVAWPIRDLVKDPTISRIGSQASKNPKGKYEGLRTRHKPIASIGVSMTLRSDDIEKIQTQKEHIEGKNLRSLKRKKKELQEHLEVEDEEDNEEWRPLNNDGEIASEFKADEDDDAGISDNPPPSPTRSVTKALQPTQEQTATDVSTVVEIGGPDQEPALVVGDIFVQCNSPSREEEEAPMIAMNPSSVSNIENQRGLERGPDFCDMMLRTYMVEGGVILQAFAESGILMQKALRSGQHVALMDKDEILFGLPRLLGGIMVVMLRPGVLVFLRVLFQLFEVGVWSSMQEHNLKERLAFLKRSYDDAGSPLVKPYITHPLDTILVDDSSEKAVENPPHILLTVSSYEGSTNNDNVLLYNLLPYLEELYAYPGLASEFVQQNPYIEGKL